MDMKTAIVTGASGFIGKWLIKELSSVGYYVYAITRTKSRQIEDNKRIEQINCDMENIHELKKLIGRKKIDAFFHLAWEGSGGHMRSNYEVQLKNVKWSCDAMDVAAKMNVSHFFAAGTITENIIEQVFHSKNTSPNMIYAVSKAYSRYLLDIQSRMEGIKFTWLQFSNVYGPNNESGNILSYALKAMNKGESPKFSKGEQPYDFIFVRDLTRAIRMLCDVDCKGRNYFIGSGHSRKLKDYLEELPNIVGHGSKVEIGAKPEDGIEYSSDWFDIKNLVKETGYMSEVSFQQGITETMEWLKNNEL